VTIGLPVYNGEPFLPFAIESILAQRFEDLELIISDNASTDRTAEICERYAALDPRIRYSRNATNLGGSKNFARVFELARGEYFKWASADDALVPDFLDRCVDALDHDPGAVSCFSGMEIIDETGEIRRRSFSNGLRRLGSPRASERLADLVLTRHGCFHVWALMRREVLAETPLIEDYIGSDRGLLANLCLRGRIIELAGDSFQIRNHQGRSVKATPFYLRMEWFDPSQVGARVFPNWRVWGAYARALHTVQLAPVERLRCWLVLARWPFSGGNGFRLLMDLLVAAFPGAWRIHVKAKAWRNERKRRRTRAPSTSAT
jgi:glycosyltransferase involved in cell wall biosynthesis